MNDNIQIRIATERDARALLEIYAPYVRNTAITFEHEVPSEDMFSARIQQVLKKYPYLVAETNGEFLGYAYVSTFKERAAYDWAVETTVYVKRDKKRLGIGHKLYEVLENILKEQGILNMNACIANPEEEDKYLSKDSVAFHEKMGYHQVGEFHKCGYKFNQWYNVIWMEKHIGNHVENQPKVKTLEEVRVRIRNQYGII